jgi:hypothetical protein
LPAFERGKGILDLGKAHHLHGSRHQTFSGRAACHNGPIRCKGGPHMINAPRLQSARKEN